MHATGIPIGPKSPYHAAAFYFLVGFMYEPFKSIQSNLQNNLEGTRQAGFLTLSQFERMTALALAQIKKNADFVEDQLDAAMHLKDFGNMLQFFQDQFASSQQLNAEVAQTLFELSQEFHAELTELVEAYWDTQRAQLNAQLPPPSAHAALAVELWQQAMQLSGQSVANARRAAKDSAALSQTLTQKALTKRAPSAKSATKRTRG